MRTSLAYIFMASLAVAAVPALAAERQFPVPGFHQILLSGSPDVTVATGGPMSVRATGADADIDQLDIRVEDERLLIETRRGARSWSSRKGVKLEITVPSLSAAVVSGSGAIDIDRVQGPFSARVSGSGDLSVAYLDATSLRLAVSGSGDIDIGNGHCTAGSLATTGSGSIDASRVRCGTLAATVTGSGDIKGQATDTATLRLTGSGNVTVTGGARCTTSTTGSGTTRCG